MNALDTLFSQYRLRRAATNAEGAAKIRKVRQFYAQRPRPWRWNGARG